MTLWVVRWRTGEAKRVVDIFILPVHTLTHTCVYMNTIFFLLYSLTRTYLHTLGDWSAELWGTARASPAPRARKHYLVIPSQQPCSRSEWKSVRETRARVRAKKKPFCQTLGTNFSHISGVKSTYYMHLHAPTYPYGTGIVIDVAVLTNPIAF